MYPSVKPTWITIRESPECHNGRPHSFDPGFHRAVYGAEGLEHFRRQRIVCPRGDNGLARRLLGPPLESNHAFRRIFGSGGRQAHRGCCADHLGFLPQRSLVNPA